MQAVARVLGSRLNALVTLLYGGIGQSYKGNSCPRLYIHLHRYEVSIYTNKGCGIGFDKHGNLLSQGKELRVFSKTEKSSPQATTISRSSTTR